MTIPKFAELVDIPLDDLLKMDVVDLKLIDHDIREKIADSVSDLKPWKEMYQSVRYFKAEINIAKQLEPQFYQE